jgi:hypothetical protein
MSWKAAVGGGRVIAAVALAAATTTAADGSSPVSILAPPQVVEAIAMSPPGPTKASGELLRERFEGPWPTPPWSRFAASGAPDATWGKTLQRASAGRRSAWCVRTGEDAPREGDAAPLNTDSWMVAGPFDLSAATEGTLRFDLWLDTEDFQDLFYSLASTDGERFSGLGRSTDTSGWESLTVDLADFGTAGNLLGEQTVWIAFVYRSDRSIAHEGAYVDEVYLTADEGGSGGVGRTFTTDDDFELGDAVGLEIADDRLSLSDTWTTGPYLWIPHADQGTVSMVSADPADPDATGQEVARYRTGPEDEALGAASVVVDFEGRCWVANQTAGTVVAIGAEDRGRCVDRNGDGRITTSRDADRDGDITGDELLAWGQDECVLWESVVVRDAEQVEQPGEDHGLRHDTGIRGMVVDADGDVWIVSRSERRLIQLDGGTGAMVRSMDLPEELVTAMTLAVDPSGALWIADAEGTSVHRLDPATLEFVAVDVGHGTYGLAVLDETALFATGWESSLLSRVNPESTEWEWSAMTEWAVAGLSTGGDRTVWLAALSGTVSRYLENGTLVTRVPVQNGPMVSAVDAAGNVWVGGALSPTLVLFDGATGAVLLQKDFQDTARNDGLGDFTGIVPRTATSRFGTWTVIHDSGQDGTAWQSVSWSPASQPAERQRVRVRTSDDRETWSAWVEAANGGTLVGLDAGRSIEVEVGLQERHGEDAVTLDELTLTPYEDCTLQCSASVPMRAEVGAEVAFDASAQADGCSTDPTWTWDFGDGETGVGASATHSYTSVGEVTWAAVGTVDGQSCTASGDVVVHFASSGPGEDVPQS